MALLKQHFSLTFLHHSELTKMFIGTYWYSGISGIKMMTFLWLEAGTDH